MQAVGDRPVLQLAQLEERLGQEVARPARRVKELEGRELVLIRGQTVAPRLLPERLVVLDGLELRLQLVEEQRVDQPVDVLHRRVVHAFLTSFPMTEGLLHQAAEDDRADVFPREGLARAQDRIADVRR